MSTHFDMTFRADPTFARKRVASVTWFGIALIVVAGVGVVLTAQYFVEIAEWAREGTEDSVRVRNRAAGIMPLVMIVLGLGAIVWGVQLLIVGARPWHVAATGTRLRKRYYGFHLSDQSFFHEVHRRFATGNPAAFAPFPPEVKGGQTVVMIWTADADRTAYVGISWDQHRKRTHNLPLITHTGVQYEALEATLRNKLHKPLPDELNPLLRPGATGPAERSDAQVAGASAAAPQAAAAPIRGAFASAQVALAADLQPWVDFLAGGDRFDARADAERLASARRWSTGALAIMAAIAVAVAALLCVVLLGGRAHPTLVTVSIIFLVALVPGLLKFRGARRRNLRWAERDGVAVSVTREGIATPRIPSLPWSAIKGVVLFDDSARNTAQRRVPVFGWGTGLALRAGEGVVAITFALHDGEAVRATVQPPSEAGHIRLWSRDAQGRRPGDVMITADVAMSPGTVRELIAAVTAGAHLGGVPVYRPTETRQWIVLLGKVVTGER